MKTSFQSEGGQSAAWFLADGNFPCIGLRISTVFFFRYSENMSNYLPPWPVSGGVQLPPPGETALFFLHHFSHFGGCQSPRSGVTALFFHIFFLHCGGHWTRGVGIKVPKKYFFSVFGWSLFFCQGPPCKYKHSLEFS